MVKKPIKINEYSRLTIEDSNYVVEYKVKAGIRPDGEKPKNEFKWNVGGYFQTLELALNDWVANSPIYTEEDHKSLKDVVKCIQGAEVTVKKLIAGHSR